MIRNTLIAALSMSLVVCLTLLTTRESPSPTSKPASSARTLPPTSTDARPTSQSPGAVSRIPPQRSLDTGTISTNLPSSYPAITSLVSSGKTSQTGRSNPSTPKATSSTSREIAQTAPPAYNTPVGTPSSATGVRMSLAPDGGLNIEIPPQAVVPAVLASDATQPPAAATDPAPNSGPLTNAPTTASSPAIAAAEKIASDFLDNIQPDAGTGETSLEQWDNATYLADERYRSFFGVEAYQEKKLKAAKENLATDPSATP